MGTGASEEEWAWAAQPPAPRVAAGSGAGCRAGGGSAAEPPGGERLQRTGAGGRAPGGGSPVPRVWGRYSAGPRAVVAGALWPPTTAGGVPGILGHLSAATPPAGAPRGVPSPPRVSVSQVKCFPLHRVRAPLRRNPDFFLAPGSCHYRQGSAWDPLLPGDHRLDEWSGASSPHQPLSAPLPCSARPETTGAVLDPCTSSQPRTSMGTWLTWTSTGGYLPAWWGRQGEGQRP